MRYRILKACLPAALCLITARHAWGDSMRCGNKLIMRGDSMEVVKAYCGRPATVQRGLKVSADTVRAGGRPLSQSHTVGSEVPVETWTYNRGPDKLMMRIRFVDGKVVAIKTLDEYGN